MTCVTIGTARLYHGDCRDILPALAADGQIGAIISDPPYGVGYVHGGHGKGIHAGVHSGDPKRLARARNAKQPIHGDDAPFDPAHLLALGVPTLIFGANFYARRLPEGGSWICWDKSPGGRGPADHFTDAEFAWANFPVKRNVIRWLWKGVACEKRGEDNGARYHPTTKPQGLMTRCLQLAPQGAVPIVDPYMGSGSTGVAAAHLSLPFIGIELAARHFDTACERLTRAHRQGQLLEAG